MHKELPEQKEADLSEGTEPESILANDSDLEAFDPDVVLSELGPAQKETARKLLREECHSFTKSEEEIGCVKELELEIIYMIKDRSKKITQQSQNLCMVKYAIM